MEKGVGEPVFRRASGRAATQAVSAVATLASFLCLPAALASFNGPLNLGFGPVFLIAAVLALPGGLLCALAEVLGSRRQPPLWVGFTALLLAVCSILLALRVIGPGGDSGWFVFPVPPLMTLALLAFFPAPYWRLTAVWVVAAGFAGLLVLCGTRQLSSMPTEEGLGALLGGGLSSMAPWQLAFILQQRSRRRSGVAPAPAPEFPGQRRRFNRAVQYLKADDGLRKNWLFKHPGLSWWLGGAIVFYLVVMALTVLGSTGPVTAMLTIEWRIADLFGFGLRATGPTLPGAWGLSGMVWAAIVGGGVWGVAASTGRFDPGRLAALRLLAILLAAAMLAWITLVLFD